MSWPSAPMAGVGAMVEGRMPNANAYRFGKRFEGRVLMVTATIVANSWTTCKLKFHTA
jgi:hypothetical protein